MAIWSILTLGSVQSIINRIIDLGPIARQQFNALAGQTLRIVVDAPILSVDVIFDVNKIYLEATPLGQKQSKSWFRIFNQNEYHQDLTITPATTVIHTKNIIELLKLFLGSSEKLGNIPMQGDYHLLLTLNNIISSLNIDIAASLHPWIGANLAYEISRLQSLSKHGKKMLKSTEFVLMEYIKEDSGLFASPYQLETVQIQHRQIQQELDRLEARIKQLQEKIEIKHHNNRDH